MRHPAAFCGIVGLKPTYGRVSRYGLIAMTSSTDVPGILARTCEDVAIVLEWIAGEDPRDGTTLPDPVLRYVTYLEPQDLRGLSIGVVKEAFGEGLEPSVARLVKDACAQVQGLGATLGEASLPSLRYAVPAYYLITPSEISSNLARYDGVRYGLSEERKELMRSYAQTRARGFGAEVKRRIMVGTYALSAGYSDAYYKQAARVRALIRDEYARAFETFDCLVTPTSTGLPFRIGAKMADPVAMYQEDIYMTGPSFAGLPAVSIPCGFTKPEEGGKELPVGFQIIGRRLDEATILRVGHAYQSVTHWHEHAPPV